MSKPVKKFQWGYTGMIPFSETAEKLGLHAYVRVENYQFLQKRADNLEAEVARLKAEVDECRKNSGAGMKVMLGLSDELVAENARLKSEVERLISVSEAWKKRRLDKVEAECIDWSDYEKLKAENARLRKAGDAMAEAMWYGYSERSIWVKKFAETDWNAAKEGKQS